MDNEKKSIIGSLSHVPHAVASSSRFLWESLAPPFFEAVFAVSPLLVCGLCASDATRTAKVDKAVVENRQGTTVIHIHNLTINLNAEMVQQLNMNPKEVINQLTEQIQQTSLKALLKP